MVKSMQVLIDGYNLLYFVEKTESLPVGLEPRRQWLVAHLNRYANAKNLNLLVVFDGQDRGRDRVGRVEIHYTAGKGSADAWIIQLCTENPQKYAVISDDREVKAGARRAGCSDLSCVDFWKRVGRPVEFTDDGIVYGRDDEGPIYKEISTKKKGNPRKLSKAERKRQNSLKKI